MPLDVDSIDVLKKLKQQGTPAHFALLTKGVKVLSLVAYRRGTLETAKKKAKEAGAGEISFGVVDGTGQNIAFKLARADGFERAPVKDLTLKLFLAESELDFKPVIQILDALPLVPLEDEGNAPQNVPPSQSNVRRPVYRSQEDWDAILENVAKATDTTTKEQRLSEAVGFLRAERTQIETDLVMMGDPNLKIALNGIHLEVGHRLKEIATQPLPTTSRGNLGPVPRHLNPDGSVGPPNRVPPPVPPRNPDAPPSGGPPNRQPPEVPNRSQLPPQPVPRRLQPNTGNEPQNNPQNVPRQLSQAEQDRLTFIGDAKRRRSALKPIPVLYERQQLRNILTECETDTESDFAKVLSGLMVRSGDTYEALITRLTDGKKAAEKYIKDHKDPLVGKLPSRVIKRRDYSKRFLGEMDALLTQVEANEKVAQELVKSYDAMIQRGQEIPFGVADELRGILDKHALSKETRTNLERLVNTIHTADQLRGYEILNNMDQATEEEKVELMLNRGMLKFAGGGTSDVRLLRNPDRSIAYAFKQTEGEANGALQFLDLPNGACALREDLCSTLTETIKQQTGLDLGFPTSKVVRSNGMTGALINGIRGKSVDPEEFSKLIGGENVNQEEVDEMARDLNTIPEQVSAKSLQNVVLFSTLACQWDCKWGNLLVEDGGNARPLDGGASFPTQHVVDEFGDRDAPLAIVALTEYPRGNVVEKKGQPLPQSLLPMDTDTVQAILQIDVDGLIESLKNRRDDVIRNHPELAPPPHNEGLVDNATLNRVADSIRGTQEILRNNPQITLQQFAIEYQNWWRNWIDTNKVGRG